LHFIIKVSLKITGVTNTVDCIVFQIHCDYKGTKELKKELVITGRVSLRYLNFSAFN